MSITVDVARRLFESYLAQDAAAASALLTDDFTFTSPQDDHIDIIDANATTVFVRYRYRLADATEFTNIESLVIRDNKVAEVSVHFGGALRT
jgi:ketosteroid isomerase-like protein